MITYNHEKYIREAIEGVLMQQTDFDFELVIGEDCSTDSTRKICLEYQRQYPEKIKLLLPSQNMGMMPNFIATLQACQGQYIALCDGDDYWTDPLKLQKQVEFLEKNPDYIIHSGNAIFKSEDSKNGKRCIPTDQSNDFVAEDFCLRNHLITGTVVFRNQPHLYAALKDYKLSFADWCLYFLLTKNSNQKVYRSPEIFSVYRVHNQGVYSGLDSYDVQFKKIIHIKFILHSIEKKYMPKFIIFIGQQFSYLYELCISKNSLDMLIKTIKNQRNLFGLLSVLISAYFSFIRKVKYISKKI
jgi:glycosyltransferase involved in cell wall biosynthesis